MRIRHFFLLPLLCGALGLTGCFWLILGAGAGAAGAAYQMGKLKVNQDVDIFTAYNASLSGLQDLRLSVRRKEVDATAGRIVAFTADDKELRVNLDRISNDTTQIEIYTLPLPDKSRTMTVYDAIQNHLKAAHPTRTP